MTWVIWYIVGCVSTGTLLTTQTSFDTFSEDPAATEMLPPMQCISPGGCWVHPMNASDRSSAGTVEGIECYYLKQNQDFPPFMRRVSWPSVLPRTAARSSVVMMLMIMIMIIMMMSATASMPAEFVVVGVALMRSPRHPLVLQLFLTPDPVQGLSVVFDATPSFFSVSYDQDRIDDLRTGVIKRKERGGLNEGTSPRIYQVRRKEGHPASRQHHQNPPFFVCALVRCPVPTATRAELPVT